MSSNDLKIRLVPGDTAPRYDEGQELVCQEVVITEQGTKANLPLVDFKLRGADGKLYVLVLTGRLVNMVSAAIKGVNQRIHGIDEP